MSAGLKSTRGQPTSVSLRELIQLKPVGDMLKLSTPRVRSYSSGGHLSPFKGRGVEFDESRPYQEGDDLRTIDWRVTARTGKPHTKVFREERNRPVILWLDLRATMMFATRGAYKAVVAARAAALIAWSAVANGDQLGGLVFSESEHEELRPRLGRRAALRLLQLIAASPVWTRPRGQADAGAALHALKRMTRVSRPGSLAFLLSDFIGLDTEWERPLRELASHCDVHLLHVYDPIEMELPPPGEYRIHIGDRVHTVDTSAMEIRERYRQAFEERRARLASLARLPGVRLIACSSNDDPTVLLPRQFARR
jgi:uncharacterized protein (DUF58 family)